MTIQGISTNVQALLANMSQFATVLTGPPDTDSDIEGYPAAAHYYLNTESNYATVSQNRRIVDYMVELYLTTPNGVSLSSALSQMYDLIDDTLDMFDHTIDLSSSALSLAPACDMMRPTPGTLDRTDTNEGIGLMATIHLFCEGDITFRDS